MVTLTVQDVIGFLTEDGWIPVRTDGVHRHYHHPEKAGAVMISGQLENELQHNTLWNPSCDAGLKWPPR